MTDPNRNILWGRILVEELVRSGIESVCISPGSRSTPIVVACAEDPRIQVFSIIDERSAAYFALGRTKVTGTPTPLISTSGTAAVNFHPAVVEADHARVPMLLLTADRPSELRDSGENQTIDQAGLYGSAIRWYRELPDPSPRPRTLRSLRVTTSRAVDTTMGPVPGPVHLNVPFRKPLEPIDIPDDVPYDLYVEHPLAMDGRDGPFIDIHRGRLEFGSHDRRSLCEAISSAQRGLIVVGPSDSLDDVPIGLLSARTGFPVLADPLSGHRFTTDTADALIVGGYDTFLDPRVTRTWSDPDIVLRFGSAPISKTLRNYLRDSNARQFIIDPAGAWREETFTATDLLVVDPNSIVNVLVDGIEKPASCNTWRDRFAHAETRYWDLIDSGTVALPLEGAIIRSVIKHTPDPSTLFVSNSMPIRDIDRFGPPREAKLTVLGNRGASGIDGVVSTALGAGSATDDPLVLVIGDLAFYHDMNGLLSIERCDVDATIVLLNNDGGGIFHALPIESYDPPFTEHFKTPHGIHFAPTGDVYGFDHTSVHDRHEFEREFRDAVESDGAKVIEVVVDARKNHRIRERLYDQNCRALGAGEPNTG